jgi:hypothetical protein
MLSIAIGNGESRAGINLTNLSNRITVGCNAVVRDFPVDHLVCVDRRMVREALQHTNCPNNVYTRQDWISEFKHLSKVLPVPKLPYQGTSRVDEPFHWGSGPYAVLKAAELADRIELIGFDLWSNDKHINNLYKGTNNYNSVDHRAIDPKYWIHQVSMVFTHFPDKYFTIYNLAEWQLPDSWCLANVSFKSLDKLE